MEGKHTVKTVEEFFSERLKLALRIADMTAEELSKRSGVTSSTISTYVQMHRSPSMWRVVEIAKVLGVSIDWLCGLSDIPAIQEQNYETVSCQVH